MAESIQDTADRLAAFISQNYTDIETAPGSVINELLIKLAAVIQNNQYNKIGELSAASSIQSVLSSSTDTYSPIIDQIASNYNTVRSGGVKVKGKVKVTISSKGSYSLREGFTFTQPALNLDYTLTSSVRISLDPDTTLQELQIFSSNGLYYFILDVEAVAPGENYQISSGTVLALKDPFFINSFVKAEAYGNFSSGKSVETDKQLIANIKYNLGNSRLTSAEGIRKRFSSTFAGFQSLSVCGANDPEMLRSKQNALGISTFGKADVYVRTSLGPEIKQIVKQARKQSDSLWTMTIDNSDAPGFYFIQSILPIKPNIDLSGTLVIKNLKYGTALYSDSRYNEINSDSEGRFTKYQTANLTFEYNESPGVPVDSYADFEVHLSYQPNIAEMQDILLEDSERLACADYLVKAVLPCMVSLEITLIKKRTIDTFESLNLQQLKKDIFQYVNSIPFGEDLQASSIVDICHNYNIKRVDLPINMTGKILCADGSTISLSDNDVLSIPSNIAKGVTPKTTQYFIDYYRIEDGVSHPIDNIGITLV